ncbi:MAG: hypothetical protein LRS48_01045 [Desulfurococcales archaeon]|nr:hypothetical protein [Desulfurococcales archaeon]
MTGVLRDDAGVDEIEPTQRVGPCLEDLDFVEEEDARLAHATLYSREYNIVYLLAGEYEGIEVSLKAFVGLDCLHLLSLHARGCGPEVQGRLKKLYENPEFTKIILEGDCIEIVAPAEPPYRVKRALKLLGIEGKLRLLAYRRAESFVLDE